MTLCQVPHKVDPIAVAFKLKRYLYDDYWEQHDTMDVIMTLESNTKDTKS